jgi:hypothetical protein
VCLECVHLVCVSGVCVWRVCWWVDGVVGNGSNTTHIRHNTRTRRICNTHARPLSQPQEMLDCWRGGGGVAPINVAFIVEGEEENGSIGFKEALEVGGAVFDACVVYTVCCVYRRCLT